MIEVEVGDTIVEFPDGTAPDVMKAALQKRFGQPTATPEPIAAPEQKTFGQAVASTWEKPPEGLSLINMAKGLWDFVKLPGEVKRGEVALPPTGDIPEEVIKKTTNFAAAMPLSTVAGGIPRGAIGMGFSKPGVETGTPVAAPAVAAAANPTPTLEAAKRVGVDLPRYLVDEGRMTQGLAEGVKNIPGAGDKIAQAAEATVKGLGEAASKVTEGYGTGSPAVAGSYAKDALTDWIKEGSKAVSDRLYKAVDGLVDNEITSPLTETAKIASAITARREASKIPGKSPAVEMVIEGATAPEGLTYEGIKGLRTYLGEKTPQELASQGLSSGEVKQLYGALSKDLRSAVLNAGGSKALAAFEKANSIHRQTGERVESLMKIVGKQGDAAPEAVYARLIAMAGSKSSADIGRLMTARKVMGSEAWNEVAAAAVAKLGRDPQGEFSIKRFLTAYGNLSPAGRNVLFRSSGKDDLARSLDDIALVTKNVEEKLLKFYNPSGTAKSLTSTAVVMGLIHEPVTTLATMIGGSRIAKMLSEPASARATADWLKAYQNVIERPTDVQRSRAAMAASKRLARFVARETGVTEEVALRQLLATPIIGGSSTPTTLQ